MGVTNYFSVDGEVIAESGASGYLSYHRDNLGSVCATLDSSGALVHQYQYKPFGELWSASGAGAQERRLQWCGSWGYSAIALTRKFLSYYVRARHYAALLGNWTSVDPLWPSEMAYGYVENGVMTGVDYWGTMNSSLVGFMLSHPNNCENRISDVITKLSGNGSPWTCGVIRLCIGQYLDPLNETGCGQHGGGHGFSGAIGAGCCVQVEIDLCALFALQSKKYGLPKIPECLVNLIKEFYNGINPIADCIEPFKRSSFECPPGYVVIVDPFSMVPGCVSSRYVMPQ